MIDQETGEPIPEMTEDERNEWLSAMENVDTSELYTNQSTAFSSPVLTEVVARGLEGDKINRNGEWYVTIAAPSEVTGEAGVIMSPQTWSRLIG